MFLPVVRLETIRIVLALVSQASWPVFHFDVRSVFLNREIQEEIFVSQPKGYTIEGTDHMVYSLRKILYGLKHTHRT